MRNKTIFFSLFLLGSIALQAQTVTNTNNDGAGSLRQAILDANANTGTDNITFNIPGIGPHTIQPGSALPEITDPVVIDGYTQTGSAPATASTNAVLKIELNGSSAGNVHGLTIRADNCTIKGLVINGFDRDGINILSCDNHVIRGNFIGTNVTGTERLGNSNGMWISNSAYITIGGTDPAHRNIISGNNKGVHLTGNVDFQSHSLILGNYIGTDVTGSVALRNGNGGLFIGSGDNTVGGTTPGSGNLISGNGFSQLSISGDRNQVLGNLIGTDHTGTAIIGNQSSPGSGIRFDSSYDNIIGGTAAGAENVIGGCYYGIYIRTQSARNIVHGNYIGTDRTGVIDMGNLHAGIHIKDSDDNTIGGAGSGEGNIIVFNDEDGVFIEGESVGNEILANAIHSNAQLGIDIFPDGVTPNDGGDADAGPNSTQNYPELSMVTSDATSTTIEGTLHSTPNTTFKVRFFSNATLDPSGFGEGETYLGETSVTTASTGNTTINATLSVVVPPGSYITSTATAPNGSTSEFSATQEGFSLELPIAVDDFVSTNEDVSITSFNVLNNDLIDEGLTKSVTSFSQGDHGTASINSDGILYYEPDLNYYGTDFLSYTMESSDGESDDAFVSIQVDYVNDSPILEDDNAFSVQNTTVTVFVLHNDSDIEDDPLNVTQVTSGAHGTTTINANNSVTYTPDNNYTGNDNFSYTVSDGAGGSASANVVIGIYDPSIVTLVVNSSNDITDGICDNNHCNLREAVFASNIIPGTNNITFNIPGTGPHTIQPISPLPEITDPVVIDGYTQTGSAPATASTNAVLKIELNGSSAGNVHGLTIRADNCTIKGLVINGFDRDGINILSCDNHVIRGNFIGTNVTGTERLGNSNGMWISNSAYITIGGTDPAHRNIISGNNKGVHLTGNVDFQSHSLILGNYIGTDVTGSVALRNGNGGLFIGSGDNTVGGTTPGSGNLISGNGFSQLSISGDRNQVLGNLIGTDHTGTAIIGNQSSPGSGIRFDSSYDNIIGGTAAGAENVIGGCYYGIYIRTQSARNIVHGNYIGTDRTGVIDMGNLHAGIHIKDSDDNTIGGAGSGEGNIIVFNDEDGVFIEGESVGNEILANAIHSNAQLGIDIFPDGVTPNDGGDADAGPNSTQNYPELSMVTSDATSTTIEGTLHSTPNTTFKVRFFSNATLDPSGFGEGETYLGETSVTTASTGNTTINATLSVVVPPGSYITSTATAPNGSTSEFTEGVLSSDIEPPVLSGVPEDILVECDEVPAVAVVTAEDNYDGAVPVIFSEETLDDGSCPNSYTLVRTWTATDEASNSVSASQTITIEDNTPPILTAPINVTLECDADSNPTGTGSATASDNCDPAPIITYADEIVPGDCPNESTIKRTWSATDACENSSSLVQVITIVDTTPPVISGPVNVTIECDMDSNPESTGFAIATDNCDGNPTINFTDEVLAGDCLNESVINRTWTVTDACGNQSSYIQTITIVDSTPPVIAGVPMTPIIQGNDPGACGALVNYPAITAIDNCSAAVSLSIEPSSGSFFAEGVSTVNIIATDACVNTETASFEVIITNEIPVIESITAPVEPIQIGTTVNTTAVFSDNNLAEAYWDWGDEYFTEGVITGQTIAGDHQYLVPGVYVLSLTITDMCDESDTDIYQYVVIYDPDGGFVTGGGWIYSPPGAYIADPGLVGKANFGFVSKYKKGTTVPTGNTEFQFKAGDLKFNSYLYDWLVVAGPQAIFKGEGHINGMGSYGFMLSAVDGQVNGGGGLDKFRIKIWHMASEEVVYDNNLGLGDDESPNTVLGGGSIVIHRDKKNSARMASSTPELEEISDIENMDFKVYPNPVIDVVNIEIPDKFRDQNAKFDIHLFDLHGIDILKDSYRNMDMNNIMLDLQSLPSGIYLLMIEGDKELFKYKLKKI